MNSQMTLQRLNTKSNVNAKLFNDIQQNLINLRQIFFYFFIKCMQSMTMTLFRRCVYAKLHVIWSKLLLYIFSLINHIDSLRI